MPPDHLYLKFKLILDNFKNGRQTLIPGIIYKDSEEPKTNEDILDTQPIDQEVQPESCTSEPTQIDLLLKNIINPDTQLQLLDKPKSLASSKRPRNKRSTAESRTNIKPSYKPPVTISDMQILVPKAN